MLVPGCDCRLTRQQQVWSQLIAICVVDRFLLLWELCSHSYLLTCSSLSSTPPKVLQLLKLSYFSVEASVLWATVAQAQLRLFVLPVSTDCLSRGWEILLRPQTVLAVILFYLINKTRLACCAVDTAGALLSLHKHSLIVMNGINVWQCQPCWDCTTESSCGTAYMNVPSIKQWMLLAYRKLVCKGWNPPTGFYQQESDVVLFHQGCTVW